MPIMFENVGIAVRDLEATIAFFIDLGLTVLGRRPRRADDARGAEPRLGALPSWNIQAAIALRV